MALIYIVEDDANICEIEAKTAVMRSRLLKTGSLFTTGSP